MSGLRSFATLLTISVFCMSVCGQEPATKAVANKVDKPPGRLQILSGYQHKREQGIDTQVGKIWKDGGMTIQYDIGRFAGNPAGEAKEEDRLWSREQMVRGMKLRVTRCKNNELSASYELGDVTASFWTTMASEQDLADFLLMVMTLLDEPLKQ